MNATNKYYSLNIFSFFIKKMHQITHGIHHTTSSSHRSFFGFTLQHFNTTTNFNMNDLSEYERKRLENIRRNEQILKELGLSGDKIPIKKKKKKKVQKKKIVKKTKKKRKTTSTSGGVRKSRRLQGMEVEHKALRQNILDPNSETLAEKNDEVMTIPLVHEMPENRRVWTMRISHIRQVTKVEIDDTESLVLSLTKYFKIVRYVKWLDEDVTTRIGQALRTTRKSCRIFDVWGIGPTFAGNVDSSRGLRLRHLRC